VIKFRAKELLSLFHLKAGAMIYFVMFFIVFAALPFVKYDFSFAKNFLLLNKLYVFYKESFNLNKLYKKMSKKYYDLRAIPL